MTAAPATAPAGEAEVAALIAALSSDDWRDRQRAEDRLVVLGAAAEDKLRTAARAPDANDEVRSRADAALARIAEAAVTGPTIVSLHLNGAAPRDAVAMLGRAAGVELAPQPSNLFARRAEPPITIALDHVSFWEAARRVLVPAGLELRQWNDEYRTGVASGEARMSGPAVVSGPFLVVAQRIERSHRAELRAADLTADGAPAHAAAALPAMRTTDFSVWFTVFAEPKLRVLRAATNVRLERAVDENGLSLIPAAPGPRAGGFSGDGEILAPRAWTASARLDYPSGAGRRISQLKGALFVTLRTRTETAEVHDLLNARDVAGTVAGMPFVVRGFKRLGEREYELQMSVQRDARAGDDWDRVRRTITASSVRVADADGNLLVRGVPSTNYAAERVDLAARFTLPDPGAGQRAAEPATLLWEVPTETKDVLVPFEFADLPIP